MKNGKNPTRKQKEIMKDHGLKPDEWLVTKDRSDAIEVVSRASLKKIGLTGGRPRTRILFKDQW